MDVNVDIRVSVLPAGPGCHRQEFSPLQMLGLPGRLLAPPGRSPDPCRREKCSTWGCWWY